MIRFILLTIASIFLYTTQAEALAFWEENDKAEVAKQHEHRIKIDDEQRDRKIKQAAKKRRLETAKARTNNEPVIAKHKGRSNGDGDDIACLTESTRAAWYKLKEAFPSVYAISTCRPGAVIATSGNPSQHRYGKAIDFEPGGHSKAKIVAWLRENHNGGIMTYSDMDHIHMDTGHPFVKLGALSGN